MNKRQKIKQDRRALKLYEKKLKARRKEYIYGAQAYSDTDRKSRALAMGECALQAYEYLKKLQNDLAKKKIELVNGTLWWSLQQQRVKDTDGKKGFHYKVIFNVKSTEPYYTEDEIREELHSTYKLYKAETEEMFGETTDEEYLAEDK